MTDDLETTHVVTVFLRHDADVRCFRRSDEVGFRNGERRARRAERRDLDAAAREEIRDETGLDPDVEVTRIRRGDPFEVTEADRETRRVVHPVLFEATTRTVTADSGTAVQEWTPPTELLRRETAPDLWRSYDRVRPTVETVADDRDHGSTSLSVRALEVLRDDADLAVDNPTFGVTPPDCVDAVVTENGTLDRAGVREVARAHRERAAWDGTDGESG